MFSQLVMSRITRTCSFGKRRRVEHWDNAVSQGEYCAQSLMGERFPFKHLPYFFSDVFDLSYEYWGDSSDAEQVIHRGDLSDKSFSVWWLRQETVVAAFTMRLRNGSNPVRSWLLENWKTHHNRSQLRWNEPRS